MIRGRLVPNLGEAGRDCIFRINEALALLRTNLKVLGIRERHELEHDWPCHLLTVWPCENRGKGGGEKSRTYHLCSTWHEVWVS